MLAIPCYVTNAAPLIMAKVIKRRHPLDLGRNFIDGRRVLGDSKSVEGFLLGVAAGTAAGFALSLLELISLSEAFVLSLGAMVGDSVGSFIKRRLNIKSGDPAPLLDQLTFLVVALAAYQLVYNNLDPVTVLILVLITPPLHIVTNYAAYKLEIKDRPW